MSVQAPGCPWDVLLQSWTGAADVVRASGSMYCEAPVCGWVETPANAHSSWAYVVVGLVVLVHAAMRPRSAIDTRPIGCIAVWLGFGSFFMHASLSFVGQVADLTGMFLVASWAAVQNLRRLGVLRTMRAMRLLNASFVFASLASMLALGRGFPAVLIVGSLALVVEALLARRHPTSPGTYRPFFAAFGCLAVSFIFWGLDLAKIGCDPDDHLVQGHAAWHLLNAPLFWFLHRFYAALPATREGARKGSATR